MNGVPLSHALLLATLFFAVGTAGLLARRSVVIMLLSVEFMLNAAGIALVAAGARWGEPDGQVLFLFLLAVAAAEVAVGLALVLRLARARGTLDADRHVRLRDARPSEDEGPFVAEPSRRGAGSPGHDPAPEGPR